MSDRIRARFEVTEWSGPDGTDVPPDRPAAQAEVRKTFTSGLEGTSVATVLLLRHARGAAYTAIERFEGALGTRTGSIAFVHGGTHADGHDEPFGYVVPGSGTGDFEGVAGSVAFGHDADGGFVDLELEFG